MLTLAEDFRRGQVADVGAGRELAVGASTVGASTAGMHHTFWNALAVEALQLLQQLYVLQQYRAIGTGGL